MLARLFLVSLLLVAIHGYTIKVINDVARCNNPTYAYPSLKLFWNGAQADLPQGQSMTFDSARDFHVNAQYLGIQENGMYCRTSNPNSACWNPDNAGMRLWFNGNCNAQVGDTYYCQPNAPRGQDFLTWTTRGTWPNCEITFKRKAGARNCQTRC